MGSNSSENIILLRKLQKNDAELIFQWRNSEKIKELSSSQKSVTWEEHCSWINSSVDNPKRQVYIIHYDTIAVGQIRFDKVQEISTDASISIYLIENYTSRGIGKKAFHIACSNIFNEWSNLSTINANVRNENSQSHKYFASLGFQLLEQNHLPDHKTYIFRKDYFFNKLNIDYYTNLVDNYGIDVKSLNWGSKQSQNLRFKILSKVGDLNGEKILDVGCGLGDFYKWLCENNIITDYTGIDITSKMIEMAKFRFPETNFEVRDILKQHIDNKYDYIFLSGIFTYQNQNYFEELITYLFTKVKKSLAFNILSKWSDSKEENEFFANPIKTLEFCKTLSKWITLRHDYHPGDFTIYIYKKNQYQ